ncbi:MAG: hypothetical protein ACOC83_06525 [Gemmatimonadota bacterium]
MKIGMVDTEFPILQPTANGGGTVDSEPVNGETEPDTDGPGDHAGETVESGEPADDCGSGEKLDPDTGDCVPVEPLIHHPPSDADPTLPDDEEQDAAEIDRPDLGELVEAIDVTLVLLVVAVGALLWWARR